MAKINFVAYDTAQTTSGGTITLQYACPQGRTFTIRDIYFWSDNTFSLRNMQTSKGFNLTNASPSEPIPSTMLRNVANNNNTIKFPNEPLVLGGGDIFSVELIDTSSTANDIGIALVGEMDTGNG